MFHSSRAPLANPHLRAYRGYRRLFTRIRALPSPTQSRSAPYASIKHPALHGRVNCYFILYTIFIDSETPCLFMVIHGNIGGDA